WCLAATARLAATWQETPDGRSTALLRKLLGLALFGALIRPEGAIACAVVAATLVTFPKRDSDATRRNVSRAFGLAALAFAALPPVINRIFTGHFATSTTQVKWLALNPYYGGAHFWETVRYNFDVFVAKILDGREWSAVFIPAGALPVAAAAFASIPFAG